MFPAAKRTTTPRPERTFRILVDVFFTGDKREKNLTQSFTVTLIGTAKKGKFKMPFQLPLKSFVSTSPKGGTSDQIDKNVTTRNRLTSSGVQAEGELICIKPNGEPFKNNVILFIKVILNYPNFRGTNFEFTKCNEKLTRFLTPGINSG